MSALSSQTPPPPAEAGPGPEVRLQIPAAARYLRLARLTASGFVVDLDFTVDDVESFRVAVDELAAVVIDGCDATDTLDLTFRSDDGAVTVHGVCRTAKGPAPELHSVARSLLDMLADEYEVGGESSGPVGGRSFRMVKRPAGDPR